MMAALAGCGSDEASTEAAELAPGDSTGLDGPVMRHLAPFANEGEAAEVRGVVEIEGDCLYVALDEVGERYPVVWPASTSWDPSTGRVLLPDGDSVGHGDSVYGGGGYRYVDDVAATAGEAAADRARGCVDNQYGEIAVVNNQADGIGAGGAVVVDEEEPSAGSTEAFGVAGDWIIEDLIVHGQRVELDSLWPITVTIEGEMISGTAACNQYAGVIDWSAEAGFGRFVVSELSWTEMGCDPQATEIEQGFLTALQAVDSYEAADGLYVAQAGTATNFHLVQPSPAD